MDEVIRSNVLCFYGNIQRTKYNTYDVKMPKYKIFKSFKIFEQAFKFLLSKNYELNLVKNRVYLEGNVLKVQIKSKDEVYYTFLDDTDENWEILDKYVLSITNGYVVAQKNGNKTRLHHIILNFQYSKQVDVEIDHIDGNPLNNTKQNLRIVSHSVNNINRRRREKSITNQRNIYWDEKNQIYRVQWYENKVKKNKCFTIKERLINDDIVKAKENAFNEAIQFRNSYVYNLPHYKIVYSY